MKSRQTPSPAAPRVFLLDAKQLRETRVRILAGDYGVTAAMNKLDSEARQALSTGPFSVVVPPDVREVSDLPSCLRTFLGLCPKPEGRSPRFQSDYREVIDLPHIRRHSRERIGGSPASAQSSNFNVAKFDRARVLEAANQYLSEKPITITTAQSPRSAGGLHDFFSEGDYWWPDPDNPGGPYIQRDGMTNPDNFIEHRRYLMRLSVQVPALVAAWRLTKDPRYAKHAARHLRAWFIDGATRMNPSLQFAQAIHGRFTGRGIGVIDTIHLVEVARAIEVLQSGKALAPADLKGVKLWFRYYLEWMTNSKNGLEEREAKNNHGTCWVMQVAAFASLTGDRQLLDYCRDRFKTVLVPNQIAVDGSFPQELRRTKPYGYSLFNLDAMTTVAQILSTREDNLWTFTLPDGRGVGRAMEYMSPYIKDKKRWPLKPDAMYDAEWPMRHSSLLFAGKAFGKDEYINLWKTLKADSNVDEVIRNFFIRQPVLWTN